MIAILVIGIIASLTTPNLMITYQKHTTVTKLHKAYSVLSNALNAAQAEYGHYKKWDLAPLGTTNTEIVENFTKNYILPHLRVDRYCGTSGGGDCSFSYAYGDSTRTKATGDSGSSFVRFILPDGVLVALQNYGTINSADQSISIYIDVDGYNNGPGKLGRDIFFYNVRTRASNPGVRGTMGVMPNVVLRPYGVEYTNNRNSLINAAFESCRKGMRKHYCSALIMVDGWKIKDDYPW